MRNLKRILKFTLLTFVFFVLAIQPTFANTEDYIQEMEYSEDFEKWLKLSEEEKQKLLMPRIYEVKNTNVTSKNPVYLTRLVKASAITEFSLKDLIPENLQIRDQQQTGLCWAFATMSSLETNLALADLRRGINTPLVYDYSERHMEYANTRIFANGEENKMGYNRNPGDGGNFPIAQSYLTNGTGAIPEEEMKFENNNDIIDIEEIQNKTVSTQVYDTVDFADYNENISQKNEIMNQVKQHIQDYGSVYASLHINGLQCYNPTTAALYCNNESQHQINHAVAIIGWDDEYSKENFLPEARPTQNGAWIARNSWGEKIEVGTIEEVKQAIFDTYESQGLPHDWNSPDDITDDEILSAGFIIENEKVYLKYGDNGLIYISYEDVNVSKEMFGIVKASDIVDYDYIYQYDELYPSKGLDILDSNIMLGTIFNKKTSGSEYLTQVSINAADTYTCKVYVNPNGSDFAAENMQLVQLKAGETETINAGYHTLEFAKPLEITGDSFAVVVQIQTNSDSLRVLLESKTEQSSNWDFATIETGKCFITVGNDLRFADWVDLGRLLETNENLVNGDSTIKAFTTKELMDGSLKNIEITTPPNKTTYIEGQNFDKTGMVVTAYYNSKIEPSVILDDSSYSIKDGTSLKIGQTSITIEYEGKTATQPITVEENSVTDMKIKTPPSRTEYKEGENFDKTGMEIEVTYKDGTIETITDYEIEDGYNLKGNQTEVTISYKDKIITQSVTVHKNPLLSIEITKTPDKVGYIVGQDFDKTGMVVTGTYEEGRYEIIEYTIKDGEDLKLGQTSITVEYEGKTATQPITVEEKKITEISIEKLPDKLTYIQNKDELDLKGGILKITYNDGTSETMDLDSEQISIMGFDNTKLGKVQVTVDYQSETTQFEVEIVEEEKPENTDFTNAKAKPNRVRAYFYTDRNKQEYMLIDTEINTILRNLEVNDDFEYYYYLSTNTHEENIQDWVEISEEQSASDKLEFLVDTREISNYDELIEGDNLYIYIREVAKKDGDQSVVVSPALEMKEDDDSIIEVYIDDERVSDINTGDDNNNENGNDDFEDNTVADGPIPQTGVRNTIIIVAIVALSVTGVICYIKYKNLNN